MSNENKEEKPNFWMILLAWFFIVLGILGIILPILPGWPFFFIGLFILAGSDSTRDKIVGWFPRRTQPTVRKYFKAIYEKNLFKPKLSNRDKTKK